MKEKTMSDLILNAVSLLRVSTQQQSDNGTSLQYQEEKLKQYSDLNDFNHYKTISDVASGGLETRDGLQQLEYEIENGNVDVVLIWNVSRVFRSMIYFAKFYEYLQNNNVELISVSEGLRSSRKEHDMIFGIMVSIATYEKSIIADRMKSGKLTRAKQGKFCHGRIPYGYKKVDSDLRMDDEQSSVVKYIFKKYNSLMKRGYKPNQRTKHILKLLKKNGFTFKGKDFRAWNIRDIIQNRFYVGEIKFASVNTNHVYPTIISKRLFNQVQLGV